MKKIVLGILLLLAVASAADARIVDYPESVMAMTMNDKEYNSLHVYHSPTGTYSLGYALDYWREEEFTMHAFHAAWLAKRWNLPDAQMNLFLRGAAGVAHSDYRDYDGAVEPAGFTGFEFDAEDRRFYFSYEPRYTAAGDFFAGFEQKGKFGIAPYVAEYGGLHTWVLLQVDHRPEMGDTLVFTPTLRFFKGDYWVEVGVSDDGKPLFNAMVRF